MCGISRLAMIGAIIGCCVLIFSACSGKELPPLPSDTEISDARDGVIVCLGGLYESSPSAPDGLSEVFADQNSEDFLTLAAAAVHDPERTVHRSEVPLLVWLHDQYSAGDGCGKYVDLEPMRELLVEHGYANRPEWTPNQSLYAPDLSDDELSNDEVSDMEEVIGDELGDVVQHIKWDQSDYYEQTSEYSSELGPPPAYESIDSKFLSCLPISDVDAAGQSHCEVTTDVTFDDGEKILVEHTFTVSREKDTECFQARLIASTISSGYDLAPTYTTEDKLLRVRICEDDVYETLDLPDSLEDTEAEYEDFDQGDGAPVEPFESGLDSPYERYAPGTANCPPGHQVVGNEESEICVPIEEVMREPGTG